eukprot:scaffold318326_cov13-Tisochrysis_lutea.AAC.1
MLDVPEKHSCSKYVPCLKWAGKMRNNNSFQQQQQLQSQIIQQKQSTMVWWKRPMISWTMAAHVQAVAAAAFGGTQ